MIQRTAFAGACMCRAAPGDAESEDAGAMLKQQPWGWGRVATIVMLITLLVCLIVGLLQIRGILPVFPHLVPIG
jgi:hypothetical protein